MNGTGAVFDLVTTCALHISLAILPFTALPLSTSFALLQATHWRRPLGRCSPNTPCCGAFLLLTHCLWLGWHPETVWLIEDNHTDAAAGAAACCITRASKPPSLLTYNVCLAHFHIGIMSSNDTCRRQGSKIDRCGPLTRESHYDLVQSYPVDLRHPSLHTLHATHI
jgi:hypothetical protein